MIAVAMRFCIGVAVMIGMLQLVPSAPAILTVMIAVRCQKALPICTFGDDQPSGPHHGVLWNHLSYAIGVREY